MPKKAIAEERTANANNNASVVGEDYDEGVKEVGPPVKLTKKGQKPRQFTENHLEKLKLAREKARETQIRNKEIRQMEKENKAEEERKRKEAIIAKNKEIKSSLKKVPNKPTDKPSALTRESVPHTPKDDDDNDASVVGEDYEEENIRIIKKEKPKKKNKKKPIVIVQQSDSSSSSDDDEQQQVVYVKKKSNRYKKVILHQPPPQPVYEPEPEPIRQPYKPNNPFFNLNYRKF